MKKCQNKDCNTQIEETEAHCDFHNITIQKSISTESRSKSVWVGEGHYMVANKLGNNPNLSYSKTVSYGYSQQKVNVDDLITEAEKKLDDAGKKLLDNIIIAIIECVEKEKNWQTDKELNETIRKLKNKGLIHKELQEILKAKEKEAREQKNDLLGELLEDWKLKAQIEQIEQQHHK